MTDEWRASMRRRLRAMSDPALSHERKQRYEQEQRAKRAARRKANAERQPYTLDDMVAAQALGRASRGSRR
jgi:hypothetical protein